MPRLEQIVAHIANQSEQNNIGLDTQTIQNYSNTLSARSQELTSKQESQGLLPGEEDELEKVQDLQEKTEEFLEKERALKEALDKRPRDRNEIRSAMRDAMETSRELDTMYSAMKADFPESPAITGASDFDKLWQTETFEDATETLSDIGNYRRSRLTEAIEGNNAPQTRRNVRQRAAFSPRIIIGDDPADYIDETAEPESSDIISAEDLAAKTKRTRYGTIEAPIALTHLSSQMIHAARIMKNLRSTTLDLEEEEYEQYSKLGDNLIEYGTAIDKVIHTNPKENPERFQDGLQKLSTLPAFLGQRNLRNRKTNYDLTAGILDRPGNGTTRNQFDRMLNETADFLQMDMNIRHLNPDYDILQQGSTPEEETTPDVSEPLSNFTKDGEYFFSINPKEDLAKGLAGALLRVENPNRAPSEAQLNKKAAQVKEMPMFVQLMKDPKRVEKILKEKDYTRTLQSFVSPFSTCPTGKKKEVLEKLKMLKETGVFDSKENRSDKWCNLMDSLDQIDTSRPETYDQQLQSIFDKTEIYQKGKKAIGRNEGVNRRFGQTVNILGILAQAGDAPKDRCNVLVDRTNYVRTRWGRTQPTIHLTPEELPVMRRVNDDYNSIQIAKKDLYQRHRLKEDDAFPDYSLLRDMPDETIKKQPQINLINN